MCIPLYSRKLHILVRLDSTSCVTSLMIFALSLGDSVVNHFARRYPITREVSAKHPMLCAVCPVQPGGSSIKVRWATSMHSPLCPAWTGGSSSWPSGQQCHLASALRDSLDCHSGIEFQRRTEPKRQIIIGSGGGVVRAPIVLPWGFVAEVWRVWPEIRRPAWSAPTPRPQRR